MNKEISENLEPEHPKSVEPGIADSDSADSPFANAPEPAMQPVEQPASAKRKRKLRSRLGIAVVVLFLVVGGWLLLSVLSELSVGAE